MDVMGIDDDVVFVIAVALAGTFFLVVYLGSIIWAYQDAQQRGKSGCLVALLVSLFSWPFGLLIWFVFRPDRRPRQPTTVDFNRLP